MTSSIYIKEMRLHAYHGVLPQEREVGNDYIINLSVDYPITTACRTDEVADTMSYADAATLVRQQMAVPSNLIEHVAYRVCAALLGRFTQATAVTVDIMKVAPPMSADCHGAGVVLTLTRDDL